MDAQGQQIPLVVGPGPLVDVAQALSDVARSLEAEPDLQHVVEGIVAAVTDTVPGVEQAGVSLREGNILRTVAATNDLVKRLNAIDSAIRSRSGSECPRVRRRSGKAAEGAATVVGDHVG